MAVPPSPKDDNSQVSTPTNYKYHATLIDQIISPLTLTTGLFGNALMIRSVSSRSGHLAFRNFIMAASISDSVLLLASLLPRWLHSLVQSNQYYVSQNWMCKFNTFVFVTMFSMSSWFLVLLTASRALAVLAPIRFRFLISQNVPRNLIGAIVVFSFALGLSEEVFSAHSHECYFRESIFYHYGYELEGHMIIWIFFAIIFFIPLVLMVFSNCLMASHLMGLPCTHDNLVSSVSLKKKKGHKLMKSHIFTVVVISLVFFVSLCPLIVAELLRLSRRIVSTTREYSVFQTVMMQLIYVNAAAKYYLYCLRSKRFRHGLVNALRKMVCLPHKESLMSVTSTVGIAELIMIKANLMRWKSRLARSQQPVESKDTISEYTVNLPSETVTLPLQNGVRDVAVRPSKCSLVTDAVDTGNKQEVGVETSTPLPDSSVKSPTTEDLASPAATPATVARKETEDSPVIAMPSTVEESVVDVDSVESGVDVPHDSDVDFSAEGIPGIPQSKNLDFRSSGSTNSEDDIPITNLIRETYSSLLSDSLLQSSSASDGDSKPQQARYVFSSALFRI